jgi:hypothetical protein
MISTWQRRATLNVVRVRRVDQEGLSEPEFADAAALLSGLVAGGAALGWVDPPGPEEVWRLLAAVAADEDAVLVVAGEDGRLAGLVDAP